MSEQPEHAQPAGNPVDDLRASLERTRAELAATAEALAARMAAKDAPAGRSRSRARWPGRWSSRSVSDGGSCDE